MFLCVYKSYTGSRTDKFPCHCDARDVDEVSLNRTFIYENKNANNRIQTKIQL